MLKPFKKIFRWFKNKREEEKNRVVILSRWEKLRTSVLVDDANPTASSSVSDAIAYAVVFGLISLPRDTILVRRMVTKFASLPYQTKNKIMSSLSYAPQVYKSVDLGKARYLWGIINIARANPSQKRVNSPGKHVYNGKDKNAALKVLGLSDGADADTIRSSFRALARKYHPDCNKSPGASEKFIEIQKAYDTLNS